MRMKGVAAIGECMLELSGRKGEDWRLGFAGDTFNTLWAMRALLPADVPADYVSAFGDDPFSRDQIAFFHGHDIGIARSPVIPGARPGLYAITLNAARDHARKCAREAAKTTAFGVHAQITGEAAGDAEDPVEALWTAVRQLPDKQREAVTLVYGEGVSHAVAADAMGISEATVSWHIHEAKKRLKVLMRAAGED